MDDSELQALIREYRDAVEREADAASEVALLADDLAANGVDAEEL
jgi:hypothetical protein